MGICTAFLCLFSIPSTLSTASRQAFRTDRPGVRRTTKKINVVEARLLLVLVFVLIPIARAQTYPVIDMFSGSGALSSNWTNTTATAETFVPTAQVGGTAVPSVSGQQSLATYTGAITNDQFAQVEFVTHSGAAGSTGPCVRMDTAGNGVCYLADYGVIYSLRGGAGLNSIQTECPIPASGDTIRLLVVGTTYSCIDLTTGRAATGTDSTYSTGNPGMLLDQRNSTVYALAQFQADCSPSCSHVSGNPIISLGSFSTTATNPGFDNTATLYVPGSSMVNDGSTATYNLNAGTLWHSPLGVELHLLRSRYGSYREPSDSEW